VTKWYIYRKRGVLALSGDSARGGNSFYISPASNPVTKPPDRAVVKTRSMRPRTDFWNIPREGRRGVLVG
jgi:hypothetical protein